MPGCSKTVLATGRYAEAFSEADILLRQRSTNWDVVVPMLAQRLKDPRVIDPMARYARDQTQLARHALLLNLADEKVDLEGGPRPARAARHARQSADHRGGDLPYFQRAATETRLPLLHRRWMAMLPRATRTKAAGLLRDGDFAAPDLTSPHRLDGGSSARWMA
jgi:hypothetical protein